MRVLLVRVLLVLMLVVLLLRMLLLHCEPTATFTARPSVMCMRRGGERSLPPEVQR
mgnify:CR=1 FL=1